MTQLRNESASYEILCHLDIPLISTQKFLKTGDHYFIFAFLKMRFMNAKNTLMISIPTAQKNIVPKFKTELIELQLKKRLRKK